MIKIKVEIKYQKNKIDVNCETENKEKIFNQDTSHQFSFELDVNEPDSVLNPTEIIRQTLVQNIEYKDKIKSMSFDYDENTGKVEPTPIRPETSTLKKGKTKNAKLD